MRFFGLDKPELLLKLQRLNPFYSHPDGLPLIQLLFLPTTPIWLRNLAHQPIYLHST